jgi:hypothetical protein
VRKPRRSGIRNLKKKDLGELYCVRKKVEKIEEKERYIKKYIDENLEKQIND